MAPNVNASARITNYWASQFGCAAEALFAQPLCLVTHGAELADYHGIFALFREGAAVISLPPERADSLRPLLPGAPATPTDLAEAFKTPEYTVIGPAFIGYAAEAPRPAHPVRALGERDGPAVEALRAACPAIEWEYGGSKVGVQPASGVFVGRDLVALAGYEIWGGTIAHIAVVTHPAFRGRGFGRSAVSHVAAAALAAGLVPQYRTLESNLPSMRVAATLGFARYVTSVAVRLGRAG